MHLRPASPSDMPALTSIASAAFLHEPVYDHFSPFRFEYPNDYRTFWLNVWRKKLASAKNTVIVAQTDESDEEEGKSGREVVGFSDWYRSGSAEELSRWNVDSWSKRLERPLLKVQERYISFFSFDRTTCWKAIDELHSQAATWEVQFPSLIHLNILGVHPDYQRQGIGRRLLEYGKQRARDEGIPLILEATGNGMPLYKKNGFSEVGRSVLSTREEKGRMIERLELPIMVWNNV